MAFNISNRHVSPHQVEGHSKTDSAAKSAVNTIDKGARAFGTSLKRGMRQAIKNFNPGKLSTKVSPYDPASVGRAKDYAQQATAQVQEKLTGGSHGAKPMSAQEKARRHQEARQQSMAQWDRQHPAAARWSQPRPTQAQAAPARPAPQQKPMQYAVPLTGLETVTKEQQWLASLEPNANMSRADQNAIFKARKEKNAIDERNSARMAAHASQPWRPTRDTRIPSHDQALQRHYDYLKHVQDLPLHSGLSRSEHDALSAAQDQARVEQPAIDEQMAVRNAEAQIMERHTRLLARMDRIDSALAKLDPRNEDFDLLGNSDWQEKTARLQDMRLKVQQKIDEL